MSFMDDMDDAATRLFKLEKKLKHPGSLVVREVIRFARYYDTGRTKRCIENNREELKKFPDIYCVCAEIEAIIAAKEGQDDPER